MNHPVLVFGAGLLAGAMNAAAGGGSFVTLPVLIFAGLSSVTANTSSTVALLPGALTSSWIYRGEVKNFKGPSVRILLAMSLLGGLIGALLLLFTPSQIFDRLLPWLLLTGTVVFAFGKQAGAMLRKVVAIGPATLVVAQLLLAVYGGYFGGAVGIMMMAVWQLLGIADLKALNAVKTQMVAAANAVAVVCFILAGKVAWPETLVMLMAGVIGGYLGARTAQRLPERWLRGGIIAISAAMTLAFFLAQNKPARLTGQFRDPGTWLRADK